MKKYFILIVLFFSAFSCFTQATYEYHKWYKANLESVGETRRGVKYNFRILQTGECVSLWVSRTVIKREMPTSSWYVMPVEKTKLWKNKHLKDFNWYAEKW